LRCDAILAAKHGVDGVFTADPKKDPRARRYKSLSYDDVIGQDLRVMDQSAMLLARDHNLPIHLFNFDKPGCIKGICLGEDTGTYVGRDATPPTRGRRRGLSPPSGIARPSSWSGIAPTIVVPGRLARPLPPSGRNWSDRSSAD